MSHAPLSMEEERMASAIVDSAFAVHSQLGPGLLESVHEVCLCHELKKRNVSTQRQIPVPIIYDGIKFGEGFRMDVLAQNCVIFEIKAVFVVV